MKPRRWLTALILLLGAGPMLTAPAVRAEEKIGLVLMHGKLSTPTAPFRSFVPQLERAGILVETPEMPWSKGRQFDRSYDEAMTEIDAAVKKLRVQGATKIVIGGHSMGAAAALIYGARHPADGLLLLALGHSPQTSVLQERFAESVARARELVAAGKGDAPESFDDYDASKKPPAYTISTTPRRYLSYFDPQGVANTMVAAGAIPATMPVLWIDGAKESPGLKSYGKKLYAAISSSARQYTEVPGGHIDTPSESGDVVLAWLRGLK